jgi:hypothetical protein
LFDLCNNLSAVFPSPAIIRLLADLNCFASQDDRVILVDQFIGIQQVGDDLSGYKLVFVFPYLVQKILGSYHSFLPKSIGEDQHPQKSS